MTSKLIILDRDGVINYDSDNYIKSLNEWLPLPNSLTAISRLSQAGFIIAVATNQSGLSRGFFSEKTLSDMHQYLTNLVVAKGGLINGIFYCPHLPSHNCNCRKPKTGLLELIQNYLDISIESAWFIGDTEKDIQAAIAKKCKPILVKTGKGTRTIKSLSSDLLKNIVICEDLDDAASYILAR